MLFSAVAVNLPKVGFQFTTDQLFLLTALPSVSGAVTRSLLFYGACLRWSSLDGVQYRHHDYPVRGLALRCRIPPRRTAPSSLSPCSAVWLARTLPPVWRTSAFFFPKQKQGGALGINGGLGNLGVSVMQLIAPLAVSFSIFAAFGATGTTQPDGSTLYLENAARVWVPLLVVCTLAAPVWDERTGDV